MGQQRARQALERKSLTQKAIANELAIASWSTVNKFFNGKPVDRFIFQEICDALNLDWAEVVEKAEEKAEGRRQKAESPPLLHSSHPPTPSTPHPLHTSVLNQATAAREALTPRILERIPRRVVREKYLGAIARGVDLERERVIPIIGPAGYGKSTILGDIYDELMAAGTPWVGLVLCSSLSLSTGYRGFMSYGLVASTFAMGAMSAGPTQNQQAFVDAAMGQSLCGQSQSIVESACELTQALGRGVLLIDTLDLVINRDFVVIFGALVRQLLAGGTTVVFTCRDHEYNDYLEPVSQRLPGLAQCIDRYAVPNFSTAEIRAAATAFFRRLAPDAPERGIAFADNVLALSADNRSLRDILENPLLLALLCDLFGEDGRVPPDLTVSKLYQRYWREKIAYSRVDQSRFAPLAMQKEQLCLQIAQKLFELSQTRLYESFYRDEIGIEFTPAVIAALNDLLSEGVLTQLASSKLHFFHQTLLEYAIAYWLARQSAQPQREKLFAQLSQAEALKDHTYWLPVLRQFLAIVDEADFEAWATRLDLNPMGLFGAVAYAAVSRDRPDALQQLLPKALTLGETHQKRLRQALAAAPRQLIENTWDALLVLLRDAEHVTAGNTVQMVGTLLDRWWASLHTRLDDTLQAIAARPLMAHPQFPNGYDDRGQLFGWLLQPCLLRVQAEPTPALLEALRRQAHLFGHTTLAKVLQSHAAAAPEAQHDLLRRLLAYPVPRYDDIQQALLDFVTDLLPHHLTLDDFPLGHHWSEVLHQPFPEQWDGLQIKAVGRWAARDQPIFQEILQDYLNGPAQRMGRNLKALLESLLHGAGNWILPWLQPLTPEAITTMHLDRLPKLLPRSTMEHLSAETQEALAQWLQPYVQAQPHDLYRLLNVLADASPTARQSLENILDTLPVKARQSIRYQLLRFQPIETYPPLETFKGKDQRYLISLYQQHAKDNPAALAKLIETALGKISDAAVAASHRLDQVSGGQLAPAELLPLLGSRFPGVRVNALEAIADLSRRQPLPPALLTQLCQALIQEENQTVVRHFYAFIAEWVKHQSQAPPDLVETVALMLHRLVATNQFEGGTGRKLIAALKVIARSEAPTLDSTQLGQVVRQLLTSIHLAQIKNGESEMIDVLCAMHRLDTSFLSQTVHEHSALLLKRSWLTNLSAMIKTARKLEGPNAALLDEVMQSYGDQAEIESLVLEARGV